MAGRPYILAETTWKAVKDTSYEVAVLPWGAIEAHNYHLPYGTDMIEGDYVAAEAAGLAWDQGARVIVLPTVPFGVNTGQLDIKLTISLNPSTQLTILQDITDALERQGIPKLVILNSHGANDFKQIVRELLTRRRIFTCAIDWFRWIDASLFEEVGDHAGEMETSLMQVFTPDWVLPLSEAGEGQERCFRIAALREGHAWTQRDWTRVTADTGVGNPAAATPEKGRRCLDDLSRRIAGFLVELAAADPDDLYA